VAVRKAFRLIDSLRSGARAQLALLNISPRELGLFFVLTLLAAAFEGVGVGLLLPVLQYAEQGAAVFEQQSMFWTTFRAVSAAAGVRPTFLMLVAVTLIPIGLRQLVVYWSQVYSAEIHQRSIARLRSQGVDALVSADYGFFSGRNSSEIMSGLTMQADRGGWAIHALARILNVIALLIAYLALVMWISPVLVLLGAALLVGTGLLVRRQIRRAQGLGRDIAQSNDRFYRTLSEQFHGMRLIKLSGTELAVRSRLDQMIRDLRDLTVSISKTKAWVEVAVEPVLAVAMLTALYISVEFLSVNLAGMGIFLFVVLRLAPNIKELNVNRQSFQSALGSLESLTRLVADMRDASKMADGHRPFGGLHRSLAFRNVTFVRRSAGADGSPGFALKDISLEIPRGALVALVGRSGAGKSTLVDLVPRLLDPDDGDVVIDGVPVREYRLEGLRRAVGFVPQDVFLFDESVYANIAFGWPGVDEEVVRRAAVRAHAEVFIKQLPEGYHTIVGERGSRLSGGQRQRIGLARALLRDPQILILDEPTSAVDAESERHIHRSLEELRGTTTILLVTHRLSSAASADLIVLMDNGAVVEVGAHTDLMKLERDYRQLFELHANA
jgi:ATP-binding cassette, subfamily B, bacterial MsbA